MTFAQLSKESLVRVSTHMPLARHDPVINAPIASSFVSTHMPLARHDPICHFFDVAEFVSTHMPLARHDNQPMLSPLASPGFYSHASCEA